MVQGAQIILEQLNIFLKLAVLFEDIFESNWFLIKYRYSMVNKIPLNFKAKSGDFED